MASLLSTPVTAPGPMEGGGVTIAPVDCDGPSPSRPTFDLRYPGLSSGDSVAREGPRGHARLNTRCFRPETGSLEWWAVSGAQGSRATGGVCFSEGERG